jgi:hypothetical protein
MDRATFVCRARRGASLRVVSIAVAGLLATLVGMGPAAAARQPDDAAAVAAQTWTTRSKAYLVAQDFSSSALAMCVHVEVDGTIQYQIGSSVSGTYHQYRNPKLLNPSISAYTKSSCSRTAGSVYTATGADLTQRWYVHSCGWHPSISVGFPWSVSVSVTPNCGSEDVGVRTTAPRATGSAQFAQFNSGSPVSWSNTTVFTNHICLDAIATATVYKGSRSDTFTMDVVSPDVCGT